MQPLEPETPNRGPGNAVLTQVIAAVVLVWFFALTLLSTLYGN